MARRTFFSFDYRYVWKVNQIRSLVNVIPTAAAGFQDASLWEEAKKKSDAAIKKKAYKYTTPAKLAERIEEAALIAGK